MFTIYSDIEELNHSAWRYMPSRLFAIWTQLYVLWLQLAR